LANLKGGGGGAFQDEYLGRILFSHGKGDPAEETGTASFQEVEDNGRKGKSLDLSRLWKYCQEAGKA